MLLSLNFYQKFMKHIKSIIPIFLFLSSSCCNIFEAEKFDPDEIERITLQQFPM